MPDHGARTTLATWRHATLRATPEFADLRRRSRRFTFTAGSIAWLWCLLFFWGVGYAPQLMAIPVVGPLNLGFLFVWSQVLLAMGIALLFLRQAKTNQALAQKMRESMNLEEK